MKPFNNEAMLFAHKNKGSFWKYGIISHELLYEYMWRVRGV